MSSELDIEILSTRHVSNPEALEILKKYYEELFKREGSVSPIVSKTLEYLEKFSKIDAEKARELIKSLEEHGLKEETRVNIANICPDTVDELRSILMIESKEKTFDPEIIETILEVVKQFC